MSTSKTVETPTTGVAQGCDITSGDAIKIGSATVGAVLVGVAIGTSAGPFGTIAGAVLGGVSGAALSVYEARQHRKAHKS